VAVLQKDTLAAAFFLTFDLDRRVLVARAMGVPKEPGKSYELWLISDRFAAPRSLGVVGDDEFTIRSELAAYDSVIINSATYAITVEPEGGSTTGVATGPIVYSGKIIQTTPPSFIVSAP
jgi:anti-sigma-K factor RskA